MNSKATTYRKIFEELLDKNELHKVKEVFIPLIEETVQTKVDEIWEKEDNDTNLVDLYSRKDDEEFVNEWAHTFKNKSFTLSIKEESGKLDEFVDDESIKDAYRDYDLLTKLTDSLSPVLDTNTVAQLMGSFYPLNQVFPEVKFIKKRSAVLTKDKNGMWGFVEQETINIFFLEPIIPETLSVITSLFGDVHVNVFYVMDPLPFYLSSEFIECHNVLNKMMTQKEVFLSGLLYSDNNSILPYLINRSVWVERGDIKSKNQTSNLFHEQKDYLTFLQIGNVEKTIQTNFSRLVSKNQKQTNNPHTFGRLFGGCN